MAWKVSNFARMSLAQSVALAATTMYVSADDALLLPTLGASDRAPAILFDGTYREIVYVTAVAVGGALTVERAQENTAARDWPSGTVLVHTPTAAVLQAVLAATAAVVFVGTVTNIANAYTVDVGAGNVLPSFTDGERATFIIPTDNTGTITLAFTDGTTTIAAKAVKFQDNQALESGDFQANWLADVRYSVTNNAWILLSDTSFQEHATQLNDGPVPAVNYHPNGRVEFWRNGTSFATPASLTETADGWYVEYDGTISAFTVNRQTFTLGQTDVPGDPRYSIRWDQSSAGSGSTIRRFRIPIPGVAWRNGETVTRTVYMKADAARTVTAKILQYFGTGGAPSADVTADSDALSLTTAWQAFTVTSTLPSVAGKTIGSNLDDALVLTLDLPLNVTMTIDIAVDDFRPGSLSGLQSDTFPVPWWFGGTGGSFSSSATFLSGTFPDLSAIEVLSGTSGLLAKTAANAWALRSLTTATATALTITNPAGVAGNPNVDVSTGLANYAADPMSVGELASITGTFGTAAFVADSALVHIAGTETLTGDKTVSGLFVLTNASLGLDIASITPRARINDTDAGANEKLWDILGSGTSLLFRTRTDADGAGNTWMTVLRTGTTVTNVTFGQAIVVPDGSAAVPGLQFAGSATAGLAYNISGASSTSLVAGSTETFRAGATRFLARDAAVATPNGYISDTDTGDYRIGADNVGVATGGTLRFDYNTTRLLLASGFDIQLNAATGPLSVTSLGFRGVPNNSGDKSGAFSTALIDSGAAIPFTAAATLTISTNASVAHPIGTVIMVPSLNGGGNITVHPDTGVTLRRGDGTAGTGDRTVAANSAAWLWKRGTDEWYIFGLFS